MITFEEMSIRDELKRVLRESGFLHPTPIQEQAIPLALTDRDVIGVAQTGTGKTLAFLVPIFEKLRPSGEVQALVVCPTRELAQQVGGVARSLGEKLGVRTALLYGGTSLGGQREELEGGVDIVVGTPGRLIDFLGSAWFRPRWVKWLVLDEADRMLDMGFIDDVRKICTRVPMSRQTMLFSATMPNEIVELSQRFMMEPGTVHVEPERVTAEGISQMLYVVRQSDKPRALVALLDAHRGKKTLVFTSTRESTSEVAAALRREGHEVVSLSSLLSQNNRERALDGFRRGSYDVMVATDVAARGIDVVDIDVVVNLDMPHSAEDYVHRVGRTGRASRLGVAYTLATPMDRERVREVEALLGVNIPRGEIPGIVTEELSAGRKKAPRRGERSGAGRRRPPRAGGRKKS